jgi:hypothetical protein
MCLHFIQCVCMVYDFINFHGYKTLWVLPNGKHIISLLHEFMDSYLLHNTIDPLVYFITVIVIMKTNNPNETSVLVLYE